MNGYPRIVELSATILLAVAVVHTFLSSRLQHLARRFRKRSALEGLFHLLGEIEVVFGLWGAALVAFLMLYGGPAMGINYLERLDFTEPAFVFSIIVISATRPVIHLASRAIFAIARWLPLSAEVGIYCSCLTVGPLLGSLITEPAAITVTALILRDRYFTQDVSPRLRYLTLAILLENVSIGGILTSFAAPPVLMVANTWNWNSAFMFSHFGWKAIIAVFLNTAFAAILVRSELRKIRVPNVNVGGQQIRTPQWLSAIHILFLGAVVLAVHHAVVFIGMLLFFLGLTTITGEHQDELQIRQSLLVAFFLGGIVILGGLQAWWLAPILRKLDPLPLFLGVSALSSITDNAALTYLGAQVPNVSAAFQYALVAGAVAGGSLTVVANAPNPAAFAILQDSFGPDRINPIKLLGVALVPVALSSAILWLL